jgi:hypothetical protein
VQVVIRGSNFFAPVATLGTNTIVISAFTTDTITGTVQAGIRAGVYALTVETPYGEDTLAPAYTAIAPATTLETGNVSTYGADAPTARGDDDHVQEIFFDVPSTYSGDLYVWIFDADTGGANDDLADTTTMSYTLYGGALLAQTVIGDDGAYDDQWVSVFGPYLAGDGQSSGGSRVFRLVVEGGSGSSGNVYNVALSTDSMANVPPAGSRIFAYSWTFPLDPGDTRWFYPYVPLNTLFFEQHNWDMNNVGTMELYTPDGRYIPVDPSGISGNDEERWSSYVVDAVEDGATWSVQFSLAATRDHRTFWAVGRDGAVQRSLAIFTTPTMFAPP